MWYTPYSAEEDAIIIKHYSTMTFGQIAKKVGRNADSVQGRAQVLIKRGVLDPHKRCYGHPWTQEEEDWLSDNWGLLPDAQIAKRLRRTVNACKIRTTRYVGVNRHSGFWTSRQVADLFGIDDHAVAWWIQKGYLVAVKSSVGAGLNVCWQIDDEAIEDLIRERPYLYKRRKIDHPWYRAIANKVWETDPWVTAEQAAAQLQLVPETVRRHLRRGWLRGLKAPGPNGPVTWMLPTSSLAEFKPRHPTIGRHPNHWKRQRAS